MTSQQNQKFYGLTTAKAKELQKQFGKNELTKKEKDSFFLKLLQVLKEPMFLLLIIAAIIYFILGEPRDGAIMLVFVIGIIGIDVFQEWKTDKTLNALKDLSAPHITVLRDDKEQVLNSADLVPGDIMYIKEGVKIPADGFVLKASTLCIDESSLTGEAEGVWKISMDKLQQEKKTILSNESISFASSIDKAQQEKDTIAKLQQRKEAILTSENVNLASTINKIEQKEDTINPNSVSSEYAADNKDYWRRDYCYAGTLVTQGTGVILVDKIGPATEYGKIGQSIISAPETPTPLQKQVGKLVKTCAAIAALLFVLVGTVTFFNIPDHKLLDRLIESILSGVTLAMAMIPEEFPVILTVFLSMGAWRLAKKHSLVRKLPSVETLGAVSVLCVDKTGTITMNQMTVKETWCFTKDKRLLNQTMGLGCKYDAYDPMEKAILSYCQTQGLSKDSLFNGELIKEYAFTNESKIMGHVWEKGNEIIIAAKGSPERLLNLCCLSTTERKLAEENVIKLSRKGLRVIAIAQRILSIDDTIPNSLKNCNLQLCGMVGFTDPPRENINKSIETCTKAGVRVVMITGDNGITASSIAKQINMPNNDKIITGDQLNKFNDEELKERIKTVSIFSRVIPEHKMRIVKAFKDSGEIVAMTGDGVNDAAALKYADIGIAMGKRGSEVSREAADLILLDDNFSTIVDTIKDGRRIYHNIRKAVGYVFSIHIPIAVSSLLAPFLGITPANLLLLPLHVVLLELVIDPTCSIILERQPAEEDIMDHPPRAPKEKILTTKTFIKSILQGLAIFIASFGTYYTSLNINPDNAPVARAMGLTVILVANILLVHVNSSETEFAMKSFVHLIKDKIMWVYSLGIITSLGLILYSPLSDFLKLTPLTFNQLLISILIAIVSVMWYEIVKLIKKHF